jgi:hypothetical protein
LVGWTSDWEPDNVRYRRQRENRQPSSSGKLDSKRSELTERESASFTRKLGVNQRVILALACELWICANIFPRRSDIGFLIVGFVQLIAVILFFLRLRHTPGTAHFWICGAILAVVLVITAVDLSIALSQLSGRAFPRWLANLGPIELVAAGIGVGYCFLAKPTRMMLLLYTITFVAGVHAVALTLALGGNFSGASPGAQFSPFITAAKALSLLEVAVSVIYPIYFVVKGRYGRQFVNVGG